MPGHLFEGNPVDEGTTGRSTDTPVHARSHSPLPGEASRLPIWCSPAGRGQQDRQAAIGHGPGNHPCEPTASPAACPPLPPGVNE